MCAHVCASGLFYTCTCRSLRSTMGVIFCGFSFFILNAVSCGTWTMLLQLDWLTMRSWSPHVSTTPRAEVTGMLNHKLLLQGCWACLQLSQHSAHHFFHKTFKKKLHSKTWPKAQDTDLISFKLQALAAFLI